MGTNLRRPNRLAVAPLALTSLLMAALGLLAGARAFGDTQPVDLMAPVRREQARNRPPPPSGSAEPSSVVYPAQSLPLRFSHRRHLLRGVDCVRCHPAAATSLSARDNLLPTEAQCLPCHAVDRNRPFGPLFGPASAQDGPPTACAACHIGFPKEPAQGGQPTVPAGVSPSSLVVRVSVPEPALRFNHRLHVDSRIACERCHGDLSRVDLATRDQLPRMSLCLGCHDGSLHRPQGAAATVAPSARCGTCHPTGSDGTLQTRLPAGTLAPAGALRGDDHRAVDFRQNHRSAAQADSAYCGNCHRESWCLRCHNAVVKPYDIHGGNYVGRHAMDARRNQPDCSGCHRQQSFCVGCHERLGVAHHATLPGRPPISAFQPAQPRAFHPSGWASVGGGAGENSHAVEARRNQRTCASCHREETCLACHSTLPDSRIPGGVNPHPADWVSSGRCQALAGRNVRMCLKCHRDGAAALTCN